MTAMILDLLTTDEHNAHITLCHFVTLFIQFNSTFLKSRRALLLTPLPKRRGTISTVPIVSCGAKSVPSFGVTGKRPISLTHENYGNR
jgi:hypothetical protein